MAIKILMLTGSLEWSLPERVTHRAGSVLQVTFRITNPTAAPRSYRVFMAVFDPATGSVIAGTTGPISIEGVDTFEVAGEGELTVVAPLKIDYSNALLQAALYDVQSGEMAVGLQALLEQPPGIGEQILPIIGFASGVMALGLVAGVVKDMATNIGR
jgi:hypothetical protein